MTTELLTRAPEAIGLPIDPIDKAINTGINHPAKMLCLLIMARQPGCKFTAADLLHGLNTAQGDDIGWNRDNADGIKDYCMNGLVPAGLVSAETTLDPSGEEVTSFELNNDGWELGVPLVGVGLDLELRPSFSSQKLFGCAHSNSEDRELMRAPLVRMRIMQRIHESPTGAVSLSELRRDIPRKKAAVDNTVTELTKAGIISVMHKTNPADRIVALHKPKPAEFERYRPVMTAEAQAVHYTASRLHRSGHRRLDGETLLQEIRQRYPALERKTVWQAIKDGAVAKLQYITFDDASRFGGQKGREAPRSRVEFTLEWREMATDLVQGIGAVRHSAEYRDLARAQALNIIDNPYAVAYLMAKAKFNMPFKNRAPVWGPERLVALRAKLIGWVGLQQMLTFASDWRERAACRTEDPDTFLPESDDPLASVKEQNAKAVCARCPARLPCLKWAVSKSEEFGVWGNFTEAERRELPLGTQALLNVVTLIGV